MKNTNILPELISNREENIKFLLTKEENVLEELHRDILKAKKMASAKNEISAVKILEEKISQLEEAQQVQEKKYCMPDEFSDWIQWLRSGKAKKINRKDSSSDAIREYKYCGRKARTNTEKELEATIINADKYIAKKVKLNDRTLSKHIDLIREQMQIAYKQRNKAAFALLCEKERQTITARLIKNK